MSGSWPKVKLADVVRHRKEFITIDDTKTYKRARVQLHAQGILLRDEVPGALIKTKKQQVCQPGEFLVAEIDAKVGGFGIVPPELEGAVVSSHYFLFTMQESKLDRQFLGWFIKTPNFRDQVRAQGSTNYAAIRPADVLGYEMPLPSLEEQRRIVARVEELAAKVAEAKGLREISIEEGESLYSSSLAFFMDSHNNNWKRETISDVIVEMGAGWSPQCEEIPAKENEWGVLKTTAVQWCNFLHHESKRLPSHLTPRSSLAINEGDVLVTRAGPRKRVGVVAAVKTTHPKLTISDKLIRLRANEKKIHFRFLELSLCSPYSQEHLVHRKTGLADAQVNISQEILRSTPVSYPSLKEQIDIVAHLDGLQAKIDALKNHQTKTEDEINALLPAILDRAFKGEL